MIKGGYKIIDLKEKDLTVDEGMLYDGIYDAIESTNKATLLSGLVVDSVEYNDAYVNFKIEESAYVCEIYGYKITVQNTDVVTVTTI